MGKLYDRLQKQLKHTIMKTKVGERVDYSNGSLSIYNSEN